MAYTGSKTTYERSIQCRIKNVHDIKAKKTQKPIASTLNLKVKTLR